MGEQKKTNPSRITTLSQESIHREACLSAGIPVDKPLEECNESELRDLLGVMTAFTQGLCNLLLPDLAEIYDVDPHPMASIIGLATVNIEELLYRLNRSSADSNFSSSHDTFKWKKKEEEGQLSGSETEEKEGESQPSGGDAKEKEGEGQPSDGDAEEKEGESQPSHGDAEEKESEGQPSESDAREKEGESQPSDGDAEEKEGESQPSDGDAEEKEGESQPSDGDAKEKEGESQPFDGDAKEKEGESQPSGGDAKEKEDDATRSALVAELASKILTAKKSGSSIDELLQGVDPAIAEEASRLAERLNRKRSTRTKSDRPRGKQVNSEGHGFQTPAEFEDAGVEIIVHEDCQNCPHKEKCLETATFSATHHRYEVEVVVKRYSARTATMVCPLSKAASQKENENHDDTMPIAPNRDDGFENAMVDAPAEQPGTERDSASNDSLAQPEDSESGMVSVPAEQSGTEDGSMPDDALAQPEDSESGMVSAPAEQSGTEDGSMPDDALAQPEDSENSTVSTPAEQSGTEDGPVADAPLKESEDTESPVVSASSGKPATESSSVPIDKPVASDGDSEEKTGDKSSEEAATKSGSFPEGFRGPNQYGNSIKRIAILLYVLATASLGNIVAILQPFLHCPSLSTGVIWSWIQEIADKVQPTVEAIGRAALGEPYVCVDETGGNVNGQTHWIHAVSTEIYTFMTLQESRGLKGMFDMGFLECYTGIAIHDFLKTYFGFLNFQDATCNEHIGRELKALIDHFKDCKEWATKMSDLLIEIKTAREVLLEKGINAFTEEVLKQYRERYMAIIAEGKLLHPAPTKVPGKKGAPKKGRARSLLDRMEEYADDVLAFMYDFTLPFTNNLAERSFRGLKGRFKISGAFRTYDGAAAFVIVWSYLMTARKMNKDLFVAVEAALEGKAMEFIFPDGVPEVDIPEGMQGPKARRKPLSKEEEEALTKKVEDEKKKRAARRAAAKKAAEDDEEIEEADA